MADILGTSGDDNLFGTALDDVLIANGGNDFLSGGAGADEYRLTQGKGAQWIVIDDQGGDGAVDTITGLRGIYASASLGYQAWASAERVGDDLIVTLPGMPSRFRKPGYGETTVEIRDHYAGDAVEYLEAGGVTYRLATDTNGSFENDIIAGTAFGEIHEAYEGNDFVDAGAGDDVVIAGDGDDVVLGRDGADEIDGGAGNDYLYGGNGDDTIKGGSGNDWIETGEGNNTVKAGAGNDWVFSGAGDNVLKGGGGSDVLSGFDGNDKLIGGKGGDTYRFGYDRAGLATTDHWGHDVVRDNGDSPINDATGRGDLLDFYGVYGLSVSNVGEAIAKIETARVGDDMVIATMDGLSSVTVENQFQTGTDKFFIENIALNGGYWDAITFRVVSGELEDLGDDRGGQAELNEFLFGTDGNDMILSDTGYDLIWTGDGADTLIYKESDPNPFNEFTYRNVSDTVMDFDVTSDRLDFTEIKSVGFGSLQISEDAEGDAIINWSSGDFEIANIHIELRGVAMDDVTEGLFTFFGDPDPAPAPDPVPDPDPAPDPVVGEGENGTVFTGTEGADVMTGTDYADTFIFTADTAFTAIDTIKDYLVEHGDMLDVSDVLDGYDPETGDIMDYVVFTSDPESDDVAMSIDADGTGGDFALQQVAVIADAGELNAQDMLDNGWLIV